jgi:hypothetical protein
MDEVQTDTQRVQTKGWLSGSWLSGNWLKERMGGESVVKVLKKGSAMRVIFFYPGEEGTYVDNAHVTLYENGIVHIKSNQEETTTHLQNCEILWTFEIEEGERQNKVRLLKPKADRPGGDDSSKSAPPKSPELT